MTQIFKAYAKKLFGADCGALKRAFPVYAVIFFGLYLSGLRLTVAPFVLYLTVAAFSAGVQWRTLASEGTGAHMQQLFMLPFENRGFVFSYVGALGAYTLLTKTAGLLAVLFAVCPCGVTELLTALLGSVCAVTLTSCLYAGKHMHPIRRMLCLLWPAAFLAAVLLRQGTPVFLPIVLGGNLHAAILLSGTDAYAFYRGNRAHSRSVKSGRHALAWRYLARYLLTHKNYLLNTLALWGVACVLPVFFKETNGPFALPIGFAILTLNTPLGILLSCDPASEQALRFLPRQGRLFFIPYCLFLFLCNLAADALFLCSYVLQSGSVGAHVWLTAALFAFLGALGAVLLEWFFPLRGWKTENDLWHHPRKYIVPAALLLLAGLLAAV